MPGQAHAPLPASTKHPDVDTDGDGVAGDAAPSAKRPKLAKGKRKQPARRRRKRGKRQAIKKRDTLKDSVNDRNDDDRGHPLPSNQPPNSLMMCDQLEPVSMELTCETATDIHMQTQQQQLNPVS